MSNDLLASRYERTHKHPVVNARAKRRMAMRDDFHSQAWAENHRQLSSAIHKLVRAVGETFDKLTAYQFEAPWLVRRGKRDKAACEPAA
jgi:hypothetical protein